MSESNRPGPTVLVTGAGGNVGLGVVRNIRAAHPAIRIIGTDIHDFTAGEHFCDRMQRVSWSFEEAFKTELLEICSSESVELVIPTTDYEAAYVAEWRDELPNVIAYPVETARCFLDKFVTAQRFSEFGIPFARSWLPRTYEGEPEKTVLKPREGRGSRGVQLSPDSVAGFDDSFVVQERLHGREITSAIWILRDGTFHGSISMERELEGGLTSRCRVVHDVDDQVEEFAILLATNLGVRGPCNIQSIESASGDIVPFEINGRYSGTNSIRSHFGFTDVHWGIQEYLLGEVPQKPVIRDGRAIRVLLDAIFPDDPNETSFVF